MFKLKRAKTLGFQAKPPRPLDEINKDYNEHAFQHGHKTRAVAQIQREIDGHLAKLDDLNDEAIRLKAQQAAAPKSPEPTAPDEKGCA